MERLQKVIAASGYTSRRKAEELIKAGKVYVNGKIVTELGTKVSGNDDIVVTTSFINMWKEGTVNDVISYYFIKANSRSKINASTVGVENIVCNFNADSYRELYLKVTSDNKKFDPLNDRELFMVEDNARIFWKKNGEQ